MTTPADFYVGRGVHAEYLGTSDRGHPTTVNVWAAFQSRGDTPYTELTFRGIAAHLLDANAWPHEHGDSSGTPWAYCWDKGTVYVYHYGVEVAQIRANTHTWQSKLVTLDDGREVMEPAEREFRRKSPVTFPRIHRAATA